jgi:hypothetical protein
LKFAVTAPRTPLQAPFNLLPVRQQLGSPGISGYILRSPQTLPPGPPLSSLTSGLLAVDGSVSHHLPHELAPLPLYVGELSQHADVNSTPQTLPSDIHPVQAPSKSETLSTLTISPGPAITIVDADSATDPPAVTVTVRPRHSPSPTRVQTPISHQIPRKFSSRPMHREPPSGQWVFMPDSKPLPNILAPVTSPKVLAKLRQRLRRSDGSSSAGRLQKVPPISRSKKL